jgi:Ca-activated chloride channel family protein
VRFFYDFASLPVLLAALACVAVLGGFVATLIVSSYARARATKRFGDVALVMKLESFDATARRAWKGVLLVVAMACAFGALARPEAGKGTRLIPATSLDVAIVLDYSKSMYAQDIPPSRIARAKIDVGRLIDDLPGARFAAVAFAGEPESFPLTSDGAAIKQFFFQLYPNDMPYGGTATARALEEARHLLAREPNAKEHARVIVLVTDGEDLEGDPRQVADACLAEGTKIEVVQIGSLEPERIPDVGPDEKVVGWRKDADGKPLTTELSAEGEATLRYVADHTGGKIVQSKKGATGIDEIAAELRRMMKDELAEKVETVYAEVYWIPLGLSVVLFMLEAAIDEAPRRRREVLHKEEGRRVAA